MKKIYTYTVFDFDKKLQKYVVNEAESKFHYIDDDAPIAQMKGGKGAGSNTSTNTGPWQPQQQYLLDAFKGAEDLFRGPTPQYYPDSTVAGFSPETQDAMRRMLDAARSGNPNLAGANTALAGLLNDDFYSSDMGRNIRGALDPTLRGDFLYGGKGFNEAVDAAMRAERPGIDSAFARSGRSGSGLADTARSQAFADAFAKQYGDERKNQLAAAQLGQQGLEVNSRNRIAGLGLAGDINDLRYADINRIGDVGNMQDQMNQRNLDDRVNRYNFNRDARGNQLNEFLARITGNYGSSGTSNTNNTGDRGNWLMSLLGGGLVGNRIGGQDHPYWGAGAGAGLGLLSMFL